MDDHRSRRSSPPLSRGQSRLRRTVPEGAAAASIEPAGHLLVNPVLCYQIIPAADSARVPAPAEPSSLPVMTRRAPGLLEALPHLQGVLFHNVRLSRFSGFLIAHLFLLPALLVKTRQILQSPPASIPPPRKGVRPPGAPQPARSERPRQKETGTAARGARGDSPRTGARPSIPALAPRPDTVRSLRNTARGSRPGRGTNGKAGPSKRRGNAARRSRGGR